MRFAWRSSFCAAMCAEERATLRPAPPTDAIASPGAEAPEPLLPADCKSAAEARLSRFGSAFRAPSRGRVFRHMNRPALHASASRSACTRGPSVGAPPTTPLAILTILFAGSGTARRARFGCSAGRGHPLGVIARRQPAFPLARQLLQPLRLSCPASPATAGAGVLLFERSDGALEALGRRAVRSEVRAAHRVAPQPGTRMTSSSGDRGDELLRSVASVSSGRRSLRSMRAFRSSRRGTRPGTAVQRARTRRQRRQVVHCT